MLETVAVLSDIHAVIPALEAVLAEPDVRDADAIVLTGDMSLGPQPARTLHLLTGLGDRVHWVKGNCERHVVRAARAGETSPETMARWVAGELSAGQVDLIDRLPPTLTLDVRGLGRVLFCHATPRDDEEYVLVDSDLPRWAEVLADVPEDVTTVVCGHTHMPFLRLVDRRTIVNAGSVGMPYGPAGAQWALLAGGGIQLRRTGFDRDAAAAAIEADSAFPEITAFLDEFVRTNHSDRDALISFRQRLPEAG